MKVPIPTIVLQVAIRDLLQRSAPKRQNVLLLNAPLRHYTPSVWQGVAGKRNEFEIGRIDAQQPLVQEFLTGAKSWPASVVNEFIKNELKTDDLKKLSDISILQAQVSDLLADISKRTYELDRASDALKNQFRNKIVHRYKDESTNIDFKLNLVRAKQMLDDAIQFCGTGPNKILVTDGMRPGYVDGEYVALPILKKLSDLGSQIRTKGFMPQMLVFVERGAVPNELLELGFVGRGFDLSEIDKLEDLSEFAPLKIQWRGSRLALKNDSDSSFSDKTNEDLFNAATQILKHFHRSVENSNADQRLLRYVQDYSAQLALKEGCSRMSLHMCFNVMRQMRLYADGSWSPESEALWIEFSDIHARIADRYPIERSKAETGDELEEIDLGFESVMAELRLGLQNGAFDEILDATLRKELVRELTSREPGESAGSKYLSFGGMMAALGKALKQAPKAAKDIDALHKLAQLIAKAARFFAIGS